VDFLLVLIELFSLGVTAEALLANIDRKSEISFQRGRYDQNFQVEGVAPTNHSFQKTTLSDLSYGKKNLHRSFFPFCHNARVCQTDRRTDRQNSHR